MISRRKFLLGLLAAPVAAGLYTWRAEPTWAQFVRRDLPIRDLPARWVGKTLVQLSDIHVGPQVDDGFLRRAFERVRALNPHLVTYTGDFVSYRGPETQDQFRRMAWHLPRGSAGTVAVLGNHDYGVAWRQLEVAEEIAQILSGVGCEILRNATWEGGGLRIAGIDDLWAGRTGFASMQTEAVPHVVLCHNPDTCDLEGWGGFSGWILAGHTHGGQCKPPFLPPPLLPVKNRRYTAGAFALAGGRNLYINRGLGHLLRVRFNVRPEVTVFRLVRDL